MTSACAAALAAAPAFAGDVAAVVGPSADAFEVASFMAERQGFNSGEVIYVPDASADKIAALFPKGADHGRLAKAAGGTVDRAVFYFSGPGARGDDGKAYIVDPNGGRRYPLDSVLAGLEALGVKQAVVVLESDFGGASINPPPGVTVVMAAIPGEAAQRDKGAGLGVFTMALLEGATSGADLGGDGRVSAGEAADFAAAALRRWAAAGSDRTTQMPAVIGDDKATLFRSSTGRWLFRSPGPDYLDTSWVDQALADRKAGSGPSAERLAARPAPAPTSTPTPAVAPPIAPPPAAAPMPPPAAPQPGAAATASDAQADKDKRHKIKDDKTGKDAAVAAAGGAAAATAGAAATSNPAPEPPVQAADAPQPGAGATASDAQTDKTKRHKTKGDTTGKDAALAAAGGAAAAAAGAATAGNTGLEPPVPPVPAAKAPSTDKGAKTAQAAPATDSTDQPGKKAAGGKAGSSKDAKSAQPIGPTLAEEYGGIPIPRLAPWRVQKGHKKGKLKTADAGDPADPAPPAAAAGAAAGAGAATVAAAAAGGGGHALLWGLGAAAAGGGALAAASSGGGGGSHEGGTVPPPPPTAGPSPPPPPGVPTSPPPPISPPSSPPPPTSTGTTGPDTYTLNSRLAAPVNLLAGNDRLVLAAGGSFAAGAFIDGGGGVNTIALDPGLASFSLDQLGPAAVLRNFQVLDVSGHGSVVTLNGTGAISQVVGGGGADVVALNGALTGNIALGDGNDQLLLSGSLVGNADLGAGDDLFVPNGGTVTGFVDGGPGTNTFRVGNGFYRQLPLLDKNTSLTPGTDVHALDLGQFGPSAAYRNFEILDLGAISGSPIALTGSGTINVQGGSGGDIVHLVGQVMGDIMLGAGADRLIVYDGFAFGHGIVDGGDGVDRLAINNTADRSLNLPTDARNFEVVEKYGTGVLNLSATSNSGLRGIDVHGGTVNFWGSFDAAGGDADVFGGTLNLVGDFHFAPTQGVLDVAPIEVYSGGVLAANGQLTFSGSGPGFKPPAAVYVAGGQLSPGGPGAVGAMNITAQSDYLNPSPLSVVPVLGLYRAGGNKGNGNGGGGPASVFIDWAAGDQTDTINVRDNALLVAGATTIDQLLVIFNPLSPNAIQPGSAANIITTQTFRFGQNGSNNASDAQITFQGVPPGLAVTYVFQPTSDGNQALRVQFGGPLSPGAGVITPGSLQGGALVASALGGGALDAAGAVVAAPAASLGFASSLDGWTSLGGGASAGMTRRTFTADVGGAAVQTEIAATRSSVAGAFLGGHLVAGFGSGVEQADYLGDAAASAGGLAGRTETGYVSAFAATDIAGWRLAAAADAGVVDLHVNGGVVGGFADTMGRRFRTEAQASRRLAVAGASFDVTAGASYVDLESDAYRRDDGLWTAGPTAQFTTASVSLALHRENGGLAPFVQLAEPVSGAGEGWRLVGVRMGKPQARFSAEAAAGETEDPYAGAATRIETHVSWRF
jgi:hypothetical protein